MQVQVRLSATAELWVDAVSFPDMVAQPLRRVYCATLHRVANSDEPASMR
jgi:hypothetical protein